MSHQLVTAGFLAAASFSRVSSLRPLLVLLLLPPPPPPRFRLRFLIEEPALAPTQNSSANAPPPLTSIQACAGARGHARATTGYQHSRSTPVPSDPSYRPPNPPPLTHRKRAPRVVSLRAQQRQQGQVEVRRRGGGGVESPGARWGGVETVPEAGDVWQIMAEWGGGAVEACAGCNRFRSDTITTTT